MMAAAASSKSSNFNFSQKRRPFLLSYCYFSFELLFLLLLLQGTNEFANFRQKPCHWRRWRWRQSWTTAAAAIKGLMNETKCAKISLCAKFEWEIKDPWNDGREKEREREKGKKQQTAFDRARRGEASQQKKRRNPKNEK